MKEVSKYPKKKQIMKLMNDQLSAYVQENQG